MGSGKKEANRKVRQGKTGDGMANVKTKGENFYRSAKRVRQLNRLKDGKPQRNAEGEITKAASFQSREIPNARIEPNRKWFGNTRVISQDSLNQFRTAMAEKANDPYKVLLKSNKLPMSLIRAEKTDGAQKHQAKMAIETSSFADTFGPKSQRKRVKLGAGTLEDLAGDVDKSMDVYEQKREQARLLSGNTVAGDDDDDQKAPTSLEAWELKGKSKRIHNELHRVLDSSDVVVHVLDARDPLGTRCHAVEKFLREEKQHKHLIYVLNKVDLIPSSQAAKWVRYLSRERPTLAMHSSLTNPFGKGSLIELLRQYAKLHSDRKQISVGMIGYPNVGKSSIINTLRKKKVANVAPIPGETKVWQYVTLTKRIYLIDCPGVVPPNQQDTPQDLLLRGVARVENVDNPEQYIPGLLGKVKPHHLERTYQLKGWEDHTAFLEMLARKNGRLLKAGEPDLDGVAKMVLNDFMRGKIPWYTPAPVAEVDKKANEEIEGRSGRLGEMPKKRKREDGSAKPEAAADDANNGEEQEFEGFGSDDEGSEPVVSSQGEDDDEEEDGVSLGSVSDGDLDSAEDESDGGESTGTSLKTSIASKSDKASSAGSRKKRKT